MSNGEYPANHSSTNGVVMVRACPIHPGGTVVPPLFIALFTVVTKYRLDLLL